MTPFREFASFHFLCVRRLAVRETMRRKGLQDSSKRPEDAWDFPQGIVRFGYCHHFVALSECLRTTKNPPVAGYQHAPAATRLWQPHPAGVISPRRAGIGGPHPHLSPQLMRRCREGSIWMDRPVTAMPWARDP